MNGRRGLNHRRRWWQTTQRGRLHWMGRSGVGKRFSRDAIYASNGGEQYFATNTERLPNESSAEIAREAKEGTEERIRDISR